jgi:hypothetical protein
MHLAFLSISHYFILPLRGVARSDEGCYPPQAQIRAQLAYPAVPQAAYPPVSQGAYQWFSVFKFTYNQQPTTYNVFFSK